MFDFSNCKQPAAILDPVTGEPAAGRGHHHGWQ